MIKQALNQFYRVRLKVAVTRPLKTPWIWRYLCLGNQFSKIKVFFIFVEIFLATFQKKFF